MNVERGQSAADPQTKPNDLGCESACIGCRSLHSPSPFIIITQPESWYSFYSPTEGRRLSRRMWHTNYGDWNTLVTYRDGLPSHKRSPILVLTGYDVAQLRWSRPTRYLCNVEEKLTRECWLVWQWRRAEVGVRFHNCAIAAGPTR